MRFHDVPLLNERFTVPIDVAEELWAGGNPLPVEANRKQRRTKESGAVQMVFGWYEATVPKNMRT